MPKKVIASGEAKIEISFDNGLTYNELVDTTSVNVSTDLNREEWVPFNKGGWMFNYTTSKSLAFGIEKKYNPANEVDKNIISMALAGSAYSHNYVKIKFTYPKIDENAVTPASLEVEASLSTSDIMSQSSTDVAPLNFEAMVNGEPTYIKEVVAANDVVLTNWVLGSFEVSDESAAGQNDGSIKVLTLVPNATIEIYDAGNTKIAELNSVNESKENLAPATYQARLVANAGFQLPNTYAPIDLTVDAGA